MLETTMKRLTAAAILGLSAVSSWAQSLVDFRNGGPNFVTVADRKVYLGAVGSGAGLTGTNYGAGLWYVPGADNGALLAGTGGTQALNANPAYASVFSFRAGTTTVPGAWNPGVNPFWLVLNDVAVWAPATLQVRVWDRVKYATFDAAFAAGE